jgi:hypothetical protein
VRTPRRPRAGKKPWSSTISSSRWRGVRPCPFPDTSRLVFSDGETEHHFYGYGDIHSYEADSGLPVPGVLVPAIQAAGTFTTDDEDFHDHQAGLRAICALAGLLWTPEESRQQPLLMAYF